MKDVHLTPELLDAVVRLELPGEILARLMWDHLPEVCPECGEAMAEWRNRTRVRIRDYDDAFEKVIARAEDDAIKADPRLRRAKRELAELLRTEPDERLGKIERATKRFSSPLLAHLLIEGAYALRHDEPSETLALAQAAHAVAMRSDVGGVVVRATAHLGNALRINALLRDAHQAFGDARRCLARYNIVDPLLFAEVDSLEGSLRKDRGELGEGHKLLSRACLVYRMKGEGYKAALVFHQLGTLYHRQGLMEKALEAFFSELDLLDPADEVSIAAVYQALVTVYVDAGQPRDAARLLSKVEDKLKVLPGKTSSLRVTWVTARIARGLEKFPEAESGFMEAINGFVKLGVGYDAALVALDLAEAYLAQAKREKLAKLSSQIVPVLLTNDLKQEAVAALGLFQNAVEQGLLTSFLLEQIQKRLEEAR